MGATHEDRYDEIRRKFPSIHWPDSTDDELSDEAALAISRHETALSIRPVGFPYIYSLPREWKWKISETGRRYREEKQRKLHAQLEQAERDRAEAIARVPAAFPVLTAKRVVVQGSNGMVLLEVEMPPSLDFHVEYAFGYRYPPSTGYSQYGGRIPWSPGRVAQQVLTGFTPGATTEFSMLVYHDGVMAPSPFVSVVIADDGITAAQEAARAAERAREAEEAAERDRKAQEALQERLEALREQEEREARGNRPGVARDVRVEMGRGTATVYWRAPEHPGPGSPRYRPVVHYGRRTEIDAEPRWHVDGQEDYEMVVNVGSGAQAVAVETSNDFGVVSTDWVRLPTEDTPLTREELIDSKMRLYIERDAGRFTKRGWPYLSDFRRFAAISDVTSLERKQSWKRVR